MRAEGARELNLQSPELSLVRPDSFPTYYPPKIINLPLERAIRRIGGSSIERAHAYGSYVSGDAVKDSLMDILLIVRNPWLFYEEAAACRDIKLGTTNNPGFHALWSYKKGSYYLATLDLDGSRQKAKIAVISHDELLKHARGGRPDPEGKGMLYQAGRLHKVALPIIFDDTTPEERSEIDRAVNRARIDGMWLALGSASRYFDFDQLAGIYVNLSYAADKRVEKANKSQTLLVRSYDDYWQMFDPMLRCFEGAGIIRPLTGEPGIYEKRMSLTGEVVRQWLKKSASHAFKVNFFQNIWTMGPLNGALYGLAKLKRAKIGPKS
ncbi:hypothetical protein A2964_01135 [Candidatus Daviesbacteria bacterium RIFCSPLOWO2_01_FULL_40_27]|nr:MAG: hypothetical protein A2964_01135 [Candidatus Daviesbacteria bacterium RIFCSPLOWO2_01_FULL_40_27]